MSLTAGVDTGAAFTGGAGDDTFVADNSGATAVLSAADSLDGGAGNDTLNIFSAGTAFNLPALTSIETVNIFDQDADQSVASTNFASVTTVNLIRGDGDVALTVGAAVTTVGIADIALKDAGANNGVTINADADATAITLNLDKVSIDATANDEQITVVGAKLTTVTINTLGTKSAAEAINVAAATTVNINAAVDLNSPVATTGADATLNISGAGKVTLGQLDNDFDVVNASGNTGGVVLTVAAANADAVITLGSGADTVTTDDDGFATADKFAVNAGAGEDILIVADAADVDTAGEATRYTNFDVIQHSLAANIDMDPFGAATTIDAASIGTAGAGGLVNMQAALAGAITITADNAGSTFSLKTDTGTSDVLSITSKHATATASADLTTVTIDGFETLNFAAESGATADTTAVTITTADQLKTVNLSGSKVVSIDVANDTAALTALDASANTGGATMTVGGQTGALVVTGSSVVDSITLEAVGTGGTQTVNAGAGKDKVTSTISIVSAATINGGADEDTVSFTDAVAGSATVTVADTSFSKMTSVEVIDFAGAVAGTLVFNIGGFANALATANSGVLKITGDTFATAAAADDITIDASSMTAGNSVNVNIKNTDADATVSSDIAVTGSAGNDTIAVEEATAASLNDIAVTGGAGNDTVTVKTTADHNGEIVISVGAGDDTVDVSAATSDAAVTANTITVAGGNNTIKLDTEGAATDFTIVLGATAATTGVNTITNFTVGTGGDVLKIDAFLDATAMNGPLTVNPGATSDATSDVNLLADIAGGQDITTAAGLQAALAAGGEYGNIDMSASGKAVFVTAASNAGGQTQHVFYGTSDAGGNISVELVGTIASADIDLLVAANFNI